MGLNSERSLLLMNQLCRRLPIETCGTIESATWKDLKSQISSAEQAAL